MTVPAPDAAAGPRGPMQRFLDLPIAAKMVSAVGLLAIVFFVVGGSGAIFLWHAGVNESAIAARTAVSDQLSAIAAGQLRSHVLAEQAARTTDIAERTTLVQRWGDEDQELQTLIDQVDVDSQQWSQFLAAWDAWGEVRDQTVVPALDAGDLAAATEALGAPPADTDAAAAPLALVQGEVQDQVGAILASGRKEIQIVITVLSASFVVGSVSSAWLTVFLARRVTRTLRNVEDSLSAMARGDLTTSVQVDSHDEAGRMAIALRGMQETLRTTIMEIKKAAVNVSGTADEIARANAQAAETTRGTSERAEVLADSADQVSRNVALVADGTSEVQQSIAEIATNAASAAEFAGEATTVATDANEQVARLGEASRKVGEVVSVITSIAQQTNLLALNATIEAARAGEAGQGFAVVAGEVKELAAETSQATQDVAGRIEAIQHETTGAVEAIEEITRIIASIDSYQTTIAAAVEEQASVTAEITRSVGAVAAGSESIAGSIGHVAESAGTSAQVVDAVERQVEGLAAVARRMQEAVAGYVCAREES
jgi:methyl-accepting chemotaxis protein